MRKEGFPFRALLCAALSAAMILTPAFVYAEAGSAESGGAEAGAAAGETENGGAETGTAAEGGTDAGATEAGGTARITDPDLSRKGSVTLHLEDDGSAVTGGTFSLCRFARITEENGVYRYVLTDEFSGLTDSDGKTVVIEDDFYNAAHTEKTREGTDLADEGLSAMISAYITNNRGNIPLLAQENLSGTVTFSGLEPGAYAVICDEAPEGYQTVKPFLVTVPMRENADDAAGALIYDVDASPKMEIAPLASAASALPQIRKSVSAAGTDGSEKYPADTVFAFVFSRLDSSSPMPVNADGLVSVGGPVVSQTEGQMVLQITGEGTAGIGNITFERAGSYYYQVSERAGSAAGFSYDSTVYWVKYEVTVNSDGTGLEVSGITVRKGGADGTVVSEGKDPAAMEFSFENAYSLTPTPTPVPTAPPAIPQTGQLWWPVWLLAAAGAALILAGILTGRRRDG